MISSLCHVAEASPPHCNLLWMYCAEAAAEAEEGWGYFYSAYSDPSRLAGRDGALNARPSTWKPVAAGYSVEQAGGDPYRTRDEESMHDVYRRVAFQ